MLTTDSSSERLNKASIAASKALAEETAARAEWARESLLALAEKYPAITEFTFETEWECGDEGDYFPTTSIFADVGGWEVNEKQYELDDALSELQHSVTHDVVEIHFGESMTVEKLKEVRF